MVTFDFTYNIVKRTEQNYRVGLFIGVNNLCKLLPYGYVLASDESGATMYTIFRAFFEAMGSSACNVLTDEQPSFSKALDDLKG